MLAMTGTAFGHRLPDEAEAGLSQDPVAEKRMTFLRGKMEQYQIHPPGRLEQPYPLQGKLALRWSNPVSGVVDGGVFVWTDGRRPLVVAKCHINKRQVAWGEAIQSVASVPLVMTLGEREVWKPVAPGVKFHVLDGETKPALAEGARLVQMRSLTRQIEVIGTWGENEPTDWALRMLTTPIHRYKSEPDGILDGAIFAFTQGGTNPEAIALIEAIETSAAQRWQVAVTRLSQYAVRAKIGGDVIADLPRNEKPAIHEPFYRGWHWFTRYPFAEED
jgi:hypothetical protein